MVHEYYIGIACAIGTLIGISFGVLIGMKIPKKKEEKEIEKGEEVGETFTTSIKNLKMLNNKNGSQIFIDSQNEFGLMVKFIGKDWITIGQYTSNRKDSWSSLAHFKEYYSIMNITWQTLNK